MSPQPPLALVDVQLERMFVAALIRLPDLHASIELGLTDLADPHAHDTFEAFANARAAGHLQPGITELADELQKRHDLRGPHRPGEEILGETDLIWLVDLLATQLPDDPPVLLWAGQLITLAETRRAAIHDAEPVRLPRKNPSGPRATNTEPVRLAEAFRKYSYEQHGEPTLVRWARAWWRYDGTRYVEHDDESLDRDLIKFLDVVVSPKKSGDAWCYERVTSKSKTIGEVRKAALHVFPLIGSGAPQWTSPADDDPLSGVVAPCANGILNLRTRELLPRTPRLFSTTAMGTRWDPEATAPCWRAFLDSLWGDDTESIRALQQMFGYLLTPDTSYQKMFMLQGPPWCGKGTIARVLRALLSPGAVAHPTLKSLEDSFGLAPLVGKTLAIIGDARLGGATDQSAIVERLLSITGEDALSINRKNRDAIDVRLTARVLLLLNELPRDRKSVV